MVGPLRYKDFFANVYKPLITKLFTVLLVNYSPRKDVLNAKDPVGKFMIEAGEERFLKNVRVLCKKSEPTPSHHRRKFITGLQKSGYWVPGAAWETSMFGGALDSVLQRNTNAQIRVAVTWYK